MGSAAQEITDFAVDVLGGMDGPEFPADVVLSILCPRLDAPGGVLQCTTWRTGDSQIHGWGSARSDIPLMLEATRRMRLQHPLMVANAAGDLRPATAQVAAGGWAAWRRSPARCFLVDLQGCDQMASLALRGSQEEICALAFARPGRDFDERELALLSAVQPFLRTLDQHVRLMGRWRERLGGSGAAAEAGVRAAGLTGRELSVLLCLSDGSTATAIAHRLGCSPRTVSTHAGRVYRKLGVSDRLTAVREAQRLGILRAPDPDAEHPGPAAQPASGRVPPAAQFSGSPTVPQARRRSPDGSDTTRRVVSKTAVQCELGP